MAGIVVVVVVMAMILISLTVIAGSCYRIFSCRVDMGIGMMSQVLRSAMLLWTLKKHVVFQGPFFPLMMLIYLCQFLPSVAGRVLRLRISFGFLSSWQFGIGSEEILDALGGYFHLLLIQRGDDLNQNAVLKEATDDFTSCDVDLTFAILDSSFPVAFIERSVSPKHLPIPFSLVIDKVALIKVSTRKVQLAIPFFEAF